MPPREQLDRKLSELRANVITMGKLVDDQLRLALQALETLDIPLSNQVLVADRHVNATRYSIEDACCKLIVTEQPAARDLRLIVAALYIIVELEGIGDRAKDIADAVSDVLKSPNWPQPPELKQMGKLARTMLQECLQAYATEDTERAKQAASHYRELHPLFVNVAHQVIEHMAEVKKEKKVTATYGIWQAAQHLDRVGDLVTNVAERVIYIATGDFSEMSDIALEIGDSPSSP
jgi:phosphate transport system protein